MAVANLQAVTGEKITFDFDIGRSTITPNFVTPGRSAAAPYAHTIAFTDKISISIDLPENRQLPNNITLKLTNSNDGFSIKEYNEIALINYSSGGRHFRTGVGGLIVICVLGGVPRNPIPSLQAVEVILNYSHHAEALICPVNGTSKFNMCLYNAHVAQGGNRFG